MVQIKEAVSEEGFKGANREKGAEAEMAVSGSLRKKKRRRKKGKGKVKKVFFDCIFFPQKPPL